MTPEPVEEDNCDVNEDNILLQIRNLTIGVAGSEKDVEIVRDVDLSVRAGETVALVGESGCGKTMTALSILGLLPHDVRVRNGAIQFLGRDIALMSDREFRAYRGREAAMVFQDAMGSLNPVFTIGAQVQNAIRAHEKIPRRKSRERALDLLELVGISDPERRLESYPHELSGGMQQRALIAIALASRPKLLIADEPTTALDVTIKAQIVEILERLRCDLDMSILLITHDLGLVARLADKVSVMYAGEIVENGTAVEIMQSPKHPYTKGLVRTMPSRESRGSRLAEISGQVPRPDERTTGCQFAPRCNEVLDCCGTVAPPVKVLSNTHTANCHALVEGEPR